MVRWILGLGSGEWPIHDWRKTLDPMAEQLFDERFEPMFSVGVNGNTSLSGRKTDPTLGDTVVWSAMSHPRNEQKKCN